MAGNFSNSDLSAWARSPVLHLQVLIVLAVLFGGGGVGAGLGNLVVQLAAIACLALHGDRVWHFVRYGPRILVLLAALTVALPLLQLIPLPPGLWQSLPGRAMVRESHDIAGVAPGAGFPFTVDRGRTLVAFLGTLAPAAFIAIASTLAAADVKRLIATVVVAALGVLLLGFLQLSSGNTIALLYDSTQSSSILYGTLANRNSTGLLFVLAIALLASTPADEHKLAPLIRTGIGGLLATGVILTQSRSSMVLLLCVLVFVAARLAIGRTAHGRLEMTGRPRITIVASTVAALIVAGAIGGSLASQGRVAQSLERFGIVETDRPEIWEDAIYAAGQYWPLGSGTGTFDEVFQIHESLENISSRRAGRAHNDYIEMAIETGAVGFALLLGWLGWCAFAALRGAGRDERTMRLMAGVGIGCLALQSLLDYPLRNQTLLVVAALLVTMLAARQEPAR